MSKQFTPCPACGALGEVNCACQFCGTTITLKEGTIATDSRVVKQRTVTPQQYAEKISLYHNVEPVGFLKIVSIGKEYGVVNLNGDLVYPLGSDVIQIANDNTIELGYIDKTVWEEASVRWDKYKEKWEQEDEVTTERFKITKYFNLETCIYADKFGFIKDKEDPNKLYRVNVNKNWEPKQTYINPEGNKQSFEYAEAIEIKDVYIKLFLLHKGNECSLLLMDKYTKEYVIDGIQKDFRIENYNENTQIILKTQNNIEVALTLSKSNKDLSIDDIYKEWNNITKDFTKRITKNITLDTNLLKQIEEYIKEIKSNPNINKYLEIYLLEEHPIFFIENNTNTACTHLPNKPGVSLTTSEDFMTEEQWEIFEYSLIYKHFNNCDEFSDIHIDFSFDAKSLCATIQYLAKIYNCPIKNITINIPTNKTQEGSLLHPALGVLFILLAIIFFYYGFDDEPILFAFAAFFGILGFLGFITNKLN